MTNETYRYLGWGITNENGVAHLDHDANGDAIEHSYTGVGAGEIDVVASLDNPMTSGSIVSETLPVLDCYKYDEGLQAEGHHNEIWSTSNTDVTRESDYTTIKEKNVGTTAYITIVNIPFTDYHIEFDIFQVDAPTDEWCLTVLSNEYAPILTENSKLNDWKHISVNITNQAVNSRVRLNTGGAMTEFRFKNFKLYPI